MFKMRVPLDAVEWGHLWSTKVRMRVTLIGGALL